MDLFGFQITRKPSVAQIPNQPITPNQNGAMLVQTNLSAAMSGFYSYALDLDGVIKSELELINRYREVATYPLCDEAIEQIVNEAIIVDTLEEVVKVDTSKLERKYRGVRKKIETEFGEILKLLDFERNCHDIFKRWYIDGQLYYYINVDERHPRRGIQSLTFIDPRKIKKVVEIQKERLANGVEVVKDKEEYFIFNDDGLTNAKQGVKISPNVIAYVKSGLVDANSGSVISYLYKAIKSTNQVKMMEDATVIYRLSRAPERRLFYIDVGNMPPARAEQYVNELMNKFRNKVQYDSETGEIKQSRQFLSMLEDFWLPRRDGKATEIQTLPGGNAFSQLDDLEYFQRKLYKSLNVPLMRLQPETQNTLGRASEITREEIRFAKFVAKLQNNFSDLFRDLLRVQLVSKGVMNVDDFDDMIGSVRFVYCRDNNFEKMKQNEVFTELMNGLGTADSFVGKYFSKKYIASNILHLTQEEWEQMQKEMKDEAEAEDADGDGVIDDFDSNDSVDSRRGGASDKPAPQQKAEPDVDTDDESQPEDEEPDADEKEPEREESVDPVKRIVLNEE